ncbi:MAG: hypothetical protein DRJ07_16020 [Bacteroidetes bacterium]|nr:MAG: hypothetical protein DRJ07_16020 [Bacteroidota bacterium]
MKRIALLLVGVFMGAAIISAQTTPQTAESLLKAKEKSDKDIENPKKSAKYTTWQKRGDLYLDMLQFNTKGLWKDMPQKGLNGAEILVGKPTKIMSLENKEDWVYERVTLKFVDGKLDTWEETKPIAPDGLDEAFEAYYKAIELDAKGKLKTNKSFMQNVSVLRGLFVDKGVKYNSKAEKTKDPEAYKKAVLKLDRALKLDELPKLETDTLFPRGTVTYFCGVMAQSGKHYAMAEKYYSICIEKEYQGAEPYHGLASLYKEQEMSEKELEFLKKGFQKYPESNKILVAFINYYLSRGESEKALGKLETAIEDDPENHTFLYAMGTLYDTMSKDTTDKYNAEQKTEYEANAMSAYTRSIEIKGDYFDALYNLGALYYNRAANIIKEAQNIPPKEQKRYNAEIERSNDYFKLALPYMEKAHDVDIRDRSTLNTLSTIYLKLQMYDKQKEIKEMLDNLPTE